MPFALLLAAVLGLSLLPVPAGASVAPEDAEGEAQAGIREEPQWTTGNEGQALWSWPEGGRIYQLDYTNAFKTIKAYDATTREQVGTAQLDPRVWGRPAFGETYTSAGRHHVGAVDRSGGRVFLAYANNSFDLAQGRSRQLCPADGGVLALADCFGGLHVLDGGSLESLGTIPLEPPTAGAPWLLPIPRALAYAPPVSERGWGGRVLAVVEDIGPTPVENSAAPSAVTTTNYVNPRRNSGNVAYAVAFDPETMRQE